MGWADQLHWQQGCENALSEASSVVLRQLPPRCEAYTKYMAVAVDSPVKTLEENAKAARESAEAMDLASKANKRIPATEAAFLMHLVQAGAMDNGLRRYPHSQWGRRRTSNVPKSRS